MKKFLLASIFIIFSNSALAQVWPNPIPPSTPGQPGGVDSVQTRPPSLGFFFQHFFTIGYNAPIISGGGTNTDFKTSRGLFHQLRDLENISLGQDIRIRKYLGFGWNWTQTDMDNTRLQDIGSLSKKAKFRMDQIDFSSYFFMPIEKNLFEVFAQLGISNMRTKLNYTRSNGEFNQRKENETKGIYGIGFEVKPSKYRKDKIRVSFQKYAGKLALLDSHYSSLRITYLKKF